MQRGRKKAHFYLRTELSAICGEAHKFDERRLFVGANFHPCLHCKKKVRKLSEEASA